MKKAISLILVSVICLSLCACGKTQESPEHIPVDSVAEVSKQDNDHVIEFDPPIVVAEDEYIRVELLKFYQDFYIWDDFGSPIKVSASTEGAELEKFVTLKFYNKCDHKLRLYMDDIYLGNDGASLYLMAAKVNPDAGKNVTASYLIRTGEKETLNSMEELYSFEGEFFITHEYEDGTPKNPHNLKFSISEALDGGNGDELPASDNSEAWTQFRDYLQKRGPVTVVTEKINNSNSTGYHQVTIEATADVIQMRYEDEVTTLVGKSSAFGKSELCFALSPNEKNLNAQVDYFLGSSDENGHRDIRSCITEYSWDIQNYRRADELSLTADYTEVDENGASIKKEGTMLTLVLTNPCIDVVTVLGQTLSESGLDVTMADLGFANFQ